MKSKQTHTITKALREILKPYSAEEKRQVFWSLLQEHSQDTGGMKWMYHKLEDFIKKKFDKKSN